ncbi:hypothetical protein VTL71DRAFT_15729 [Oculimacula yallundae]|uniref:Uncharacterized protein n=1 Tax=Oculimacula yallundae TaxID=86028 RepID=A0ABR4CCF9_9HELO
MPYASVTESIWRKLETEGSARRPTKSRSSFENVCDAFYQAEYCPYPHSEGESIRHVKMYRAEWNIHMYYYEFIICLTSRSRILIPHTVGDDSDFEGEDPATITFILSAKEIARSRPLPSSNPPANQPTNSPAPPSYIVVDLQSAEEARTMLETAIRRRNRSTNTAYKVQMGWNPRTGEPWFAVRSYASNSFPALWGPNRSALRDVYAMVPEFVLQFERFPERGYTLLWPEFASPASVYDKEIWVKLSQFRAFLEEWAGKKGNVMLISECLRAYVERTRGERPVSAMPAGFVLDEGLKERVLSLPPPSR